jgi:hypothetical protein
MKKKYYFLILLMIAGYSSRSQYIMGMHVVPQNPTTTDVVSLVADLSFTSGSCDQKTMNFSQNGNTFYGYALHCVGPLAYICYETDSFPVGLLPAGNYQFVFSVDAGYGGSPCTPGIVPGPSDTLLFTVTTVTGLHEIISNDVLMSMVNNILFVKPSSQSNSVRSHIYLYSAAGQQVITSDIGGEQSFDLTDLSPGIYTALYISASEKTNFRFIVH